MHTACQLAKHMAYLADFSSNKCLVDPLGWSNPQTTARTVVDLLITRGSFPVWDGRCCPTGPLRFSSVTSSMPACLSHILRGIAFITFFFLLASTPSCASDRHARHPVIDQVDALRRAYYELGNRVHRTLLVQLGDLGQIEGQLASARHFLSSVEQVTNLLVII